MLKIGITVELPICKPQNSLGFGPETKSEADRQKKIETIYTIVYFLKGHKFISLSRNQKSVLKAQMSVMNNKVGKDIEQLCRPTFLIQISFF
jgi:hypothetical protein